MRNLVNHDSPKAISRFLEERNIAATRRFGQNFLVNRGAREKITALLESGPEYRVWEIGPGLGAMTSHLLPVSRKLTLFEIDRGFAAVLRELYGDEAQVEIVEGDVLQSWPQVCRREGVPERIVGNLPYNVGSRIIASLIEGGCIPERMVCTVQREVGLRMMARPGTAEWSSFSVLCQFAFSVTDGGDLKAGSFYPPPRVTSKAVVLTARREYSPELAPEVSRAARELFSSRRKTIRNVLKGGELMRQHGEERLLGALREAGIDPSMRGETLSVATIVDLVRRLRGK